MESLRQLDRAPVLNTSVTLLVPLALLAALTGLSGDLLLERIVTVMFIHLILVTGLQIFMGNSGIVSFAHIGFMGIGAYASVIFSLDPDVKAMTLRHLYDFLKPIDLPFWMALLIGTGIGTLIAAVISFPLMRLHDAAAVITSFAVLVVIHDIIVHWSEVTNGPRTLYGVERETYLWNSALFAGVALVFAVWFRESRIGLQLRASRDDRMAAQAVGVDMVLVRWVGFVLMCGYAAFAGGLFAHFITSFQPGQFYLAEVFLVVAMLVIGGPGSVSGAVVGTILVTALREGLRTGEAQLNLMQIFSGQVVGLTEFLLAISMIAILIFRPAGLMQGRELRLPLRRKRLSGAASRRGAAGDHL
jgi:branched-chain amino acid transport system permease protein